MAFAVIDFETTGILPSHHHRVVEVGVVHVENDGSVSGRWETLVNPQRDLGRQDIHGIRAVDILDAPHFSDIAGEFAELLRGRAVVGHNVTFDLRFLLAEFERAGHSLDPDLPHLCTMRLGASFGLGGNCALATACETLGLTLDNAHTAGDDAHAAAQLLSHYQHTSATWEGWADYWAAWDSSATSYSYPALTPSGVVWQARAVGEAAQVSYLERLAQSSSISVPPGADATYLALLDRCLLDGNISVSESAAIVHVAAELGLTRAEVDALNERYYMDITQRAWVDGVLTTEERVELDRVADLLQLPEAVRKTAVSRPTADDLPATETIDHFALGPGDMIVLTGEMSRAREEWCAILEGLGYVIHGAVTKKVRLVVAADPDSLSGKARKAREYDIPIVDEAGLVRMLTEHHTAEAPAKGVGGE